MTDLFEKYQELIQHYIIDDNKENFEKKFADC